MPGKAMPRPRPWLPLDLDYLDQDTIRELLSEFGAAGPLIFIAILLEAGKQARAGLPVSQQGTMTARAAALAMKVGSDAETVCRIVHRCVAIGLLELLDGSDLDAGRLVVRSLKRGPWEPKDASATRRDARRRQRLAQTETDGDSEDQDYINF